MSVTILNGDCRDVLRSLPDGSVHCCVTSPPYFGLRDYDVDGQIGLEQTPDAFVAELVAVFADVRRVLRDDGTLWLNLGDSYANHAKWGGSSGGKHVSALHGGSGPGRAKVKTGLKSKDLIGIPWMVAFALRADGWYLRQEIIWHKPNPMPESVTDRCTKAHEQIFLLSKSPKYWFDSAAIAEPLGKGWDGSEFNAGKTAEHQMGRSQGGRRAPGNTIHKGLAAYEDGDEKMRTKAGLIGFAERERAKVDAGELDGTRNKRSVWTVATQGFSEAHFATFPPALIDPCILAGCPLGGTVLDPFGGAGTTGLVAQDLGRSAILIELNPAYAAMAERRLSSANVGLPLIGSAA